MLSSGSLSATSTAFSCSDPSSPVARDSPPAVVCLSLMAEMARLVGFVTPVGFPWSL